MLKNIILTGYFLGKPDLQRPETRQNSSFDYFSRLYESAERLNLNLIIFHDHLALELTNKYSTERVKFIKVSLQTDYTLNDERFLIVKEHLEVNKYGKVLIVDASDVWFGRNPFDYILDRRKLYFGDEEKLIGGSNWMKEGFINLYGTIPNEILDKPILNCGAIGGGYSEVLRLLIKFEKELKRINNPKLINDMIVFNEIIYRDYNDSCIIHGTPFNSPFKKFLYTGEYYIYHK